MEKKRIMKRKKKYNLKNALEKLNIGDGFSKHEFIISMWGDVNHKLERSFDVVFHEAKKEFPNKEFKSIKKVITRIL
jgi:UDP-N-acetylglucosamine transferase subunit ALG13